MSYILEALKKAQAERQLGETPTIHTPQLPAAPSGPGRRVLRPPMLAAVALLMLAVAALGWMLWRRPPPAPAAPVPAAAPVPTAAPAATPAAAAMSASAPAPAPKPAAASNTAPAAASASAPLAARPASAGKAAPPSAVAGGMPPPKAATPVPPTPGTAAARAGAAAVSAAAPAETDDSLPTLRELPDAVSQGIPQPPIGGYIYSKNPADRLLLVDKVLRHEGEEVAPGLTLEKLLPKSAVFNFRGRRYRVPY